MEAYWWILYWIVSAAAIVQSLLVVIQTWEHRRYARSSLRNLNRHQPAGRVLLCAPCKGHDINLEDNLRALLEQDYDDYEVAFIVESAADPAYPVIRRVMAAHPWMPARLIVAGRATYTGQKVHNLRVATTRISPRIKYLAFVDSDARPKPEWLRMLIARLNRPHIGAVTGYRWFVPERDTVANHLLCSLNCCIMSLLGRNSHYLLWGGSWAIRRELFEKIGIHSAWKDTLSDDFVVGRLLRKAKLQVRFEPSCVVASPIDNSLYGAFSFVRRQYLLARFYARNWWTFAVVALTFSNLIWLANLLMLVLSILNGATWCWIPATVISILYLLKIFRTAVSQSLADLYFPHLRKTLRRAKQFDILLQPFISLIHGIIVWSSSFGRHVTWRGISYRLSAHGKIQRTWHTDDPPVLPMPGIAGNSSKFLGKLAGLRKAG